MIICEDDKLLDAACWFARELKISHLDFTLEIQTYSANDGGTGWIEYSDYVSVINLNTVLNPREDVLDVLAHEMVHLKQYLTGQLKEVPGMNLCVWEGQVYPASNDPTSTFYWEAPWEIEAFGRSAGLEYRYKAQLNA